MQRLLLLLTLISVSSSSVLAQSHNYDLPIREQMFDNGLRLLVLEQPGNHRVACKIFFDMGALVEAPGDLGASHFLEHLMFKGTHTLGTTNWEAERPLVDTMYETEAALIEEKNRARNVLRERGVFHDYRHATSTPEADRLQQELVSIDRKMAPYRDSGAMMRWYQAYGGTRLTASTEQEYMKFDINLPASRVELFLRVEADRMRNSVFREFDQERMILVEQRLGDLGRPTTTYYEAMNALVGDVHPVYYPEGYLTDFDLYTRYRERDIYEEYFVVNNATLVFVGGVTLDAMIPLVEEYFGWVEPSPEPTRVGAVEPVPAAEKRMIWRSDTLEPRVEARYKIPGIGHPDRPLVDVLAEVVATRLEDALSVEDVPGRVNVNTRVVHASRFGVPSTLNLEIVTAEEHLADAERVVGEVLGELRRAPAASPSIDAAKKRLRTAWHRTAGNPDRLAFEIGHFQVMDRWQTLQAHLEARDATTAADLQRIAAKYFISENRTVGLVRRPEQEDPEPEVR